MFKPVPIHILTPLQFDRQLKVKRNNHLLMYLMYVYIANVSLRYRLLKIPFECTYINSAE